ncbi:hypothetical protein ACFC58_04950 [Kitasatospora purpeofusca]|uniref:hypothetical protein n=1 Tax=Kitasatospora purpeofusca TaxID=67352 RepID=UPI0035DDFB0F
MAAEGAVGAAEIVHGCLRWDWRWDSTDDRALYLARLVRDLALPLGPVVEGLGGDEGTCERAARVLELLALGGSGEAREALREYVLEGEHWRDVLESVAGCWPVEWWDDLEGAVRHRLKGDEKYLRGEPWARWGSAMAHVEPVVRPDPLAGETSARLLELLADLGARQEWRHVMVELARREAEPGLLPLVPSLGPADGGYPLPLLPRALRKLGVLAVPAAREWARAEEDWLAGLGLGVLAEHGEAEDIPALVAELERDWVERRWCGSMYTARGLARFGAEARGAASLLRRFWLWTPHSYERASYLEALAAIEPAGLESVYVECLWDCEEDARLLGVQHAPDGVEVRERLEYLADDLMEEETVRAAALERLAALTE